MVLLLLFFAMFVVAMHDVLLLVGDGGCLNFGGYSLYLRLGWYNTLRTSIVDVVLDLFGIVNGKCGMSCKLQQLGCSLRTVII
jgi:hypothetical protein